MQWKEDSSEVKNEKKKKHKLDGDYKVREDVSV
jgi:hypothetical protein